MDHTRRCVSTETDEESNGNIDFAIDTPLQCLTIPLTSTNREEGDHLFKTKLDE